MKFGSQTKYEVFLKVEEALGRILLVPSAFRRLSSVFGRLQNPVVLVLSSKSGRLRMPSKPSVS